MREACAVSAIRHSCCGFRLSSSWFLFVPLAYLFIFIFHWGSMGAWIAFYSFLMVLAISIMIRFYRTDWTAVRLKEAAHG